MYTNQVKKIALVTLATVALCNTHAMRSMALTVAVAKPVAINWAERGYKLFLDRSAKDLQFGLFGCGLTAIASTAGYFYTKKQNEVHHRVHAKIAAIKNKLNEAADIHHVDVPGLEALIAQAEADTECQQYMYNPKQDSYTPIEKIQETAQAKIHYGNFKTYWANFIDRNFNLSEDARGVHLANARTTFDLYYTLAQKTCPTSTPPNLKNWVIASACTSIGIGLGCVFLKPAFDTILNFRLPLWNFKLPL